MRSSQLLTLFFLFLILESPAQEKASYSILFYNTENLFDWENDSTVNDNEFTPEGDRHWTYNRFQQKIQNISKSVLGSAGWDTPALIGLCEIENRFVLDQLISKTALKAYPFKIIHKDSPDPRGIDVAALYNSEIFNPIQYEYYPLLNENGSIHRSREILYLKGKVASCPDTIHFFFNHWPSRYSGLLETTEWRIKAAQLLKQKTDSLFQIDLDSHIIIMGDFNDQPNDISIRESLDAKPIADEIQAGALYNLSYEWGNNGKGSLKYQSQWFLFDQAMVSTSLLKNDSTPEIKVAEANIADNNFLLEPDERYGGEKPKRTYYGFEYQGGFSDHLPVKLKIEIR